MAFRKISDFINESVVTPFIIDTLDKNLVAANAVTMHTQAELGFGSSYKVPGTGDLTLTQYGGSAVTPQYVSSTSVNINIDKFPYVPFYLLDSDVNESNALSTATIYAERAGYKIQLDTDTDVFNALYAGASYTTSGALGVTSGAIALTDSTKVLDYLEKFATTLREANADANAVITIPSFMATALAKEIGIKAQNDSLAGDIVPGYVTRLFGMDILTSNNMPTGVAGGLVAGEYVVLGGKRDAFHYVRGTTIAKSGDSETNPGSWNQYGQVYGRGFSQPLAYYSGVVKKS